MYILKLTWWLWNQMFQYAFIRALSLRNGGVFLLDKSYLDKRDKRHYELNIFNIQAPFAKNDEIPWYENLWGGKGHKLDIQTILQYVFKTINKNHYIELSSGKLNKIFKYEPTSIKDAIDKFKNVKWWYIEWLFQSELYFADFKRTIKWDFNFIKPISNQSKLIEQKIISSNSVWIHVRRGDYLSPFWIKRFWVIELPYYKYAMTYMRKNLKAAPLFFCFSDDINWCKNNFKWDNIYYIDWNKGDESWQDMYLLSKCKHNIISNSTFAWRWARLNDNPEKIVIAPEKWFIMNDPRFDYIIPKSRTKCKNLPK